MNQKKGIYKGLIGNWEITTEEIEGNEYITSIVNIRYNFNCNVLSSNDKKRSSDLNQWDNNCDTNSNYEETNLIRETKKQLDEYFKGQRKEFDLPLYPVGTAFQQKVWGALGDIPYGETRTYGEIARQVGNPKGQRAVGMANNKNKIAIVIPCHRVIGANGKLIGYAGGLDIKEALLNLEKTNNNRRIKK